MAVIDEPEKVVNEELEKELAKLDSMLKEWGGLETLHPPHTISTGNVQHEIDSLSHNIMILPLLIQMAKDELRPLTKQYAEEYLEIQTTLTPELCIKENIKGNQQNIYINRILDGSIGSEKREYENKIDKLERILKANENLLWRYRAKTGQ